MGYDRARGIKEVSLQSDVSPFEDTIEIPWPQHVLTIERNNRAVIWISTVAFPLIFIKRRFSSWNIEICWTFQRTAQFHSGTNKEEIIGAYFNEYSQDLWTETASVNLLAFEGFRKHFQDILDMYDRISQWEGIWVNSEGNYLDVWNGRWID